MGYSLPSEVWAITKIITALSVPNVTDFIKDADNWIDTCLRPIYQVPIEKQSYNTGTITISSSNTTLTGTSTLFKSELRKKREFHIYVVDTDEVILVSSYTNDTAGVLAVAPSQSSTNSDFYSIPEEISLASKYLACQMIINKEFSKEAYNQEAEAYAQLYNKFAKGIIDKLEKQDYYNTDLLLQADSKNNNRLGKIVIPDTNLRNNITSAQSLFSSIKFR